MAVRRAVDGVAVTRANEEKGNERLMKEVEEEEEES
jgi:hypothetical protein